MPYGNGRARLLASETPQAIIASVLFHRGEVDDRART